MTTKTGEVAGDDDSHSRRFSTAAFVTSDNINVNTDVQHIIFILQHLSRLPFHRLKLAQPNSETQTNDHIVPAHPHPQAATIQLQAPCPQNSTSNLSSPSTTQHVKPPPLRSIAIEHSLLKYSLDKFRH